MKLLLRPLLLSVTALVGLAALRAEAQVEVNTGAEQVRQNVELKLLRTLETYLGDRSKVLVSVNFKYPPPTEGAKAPESEAVPGADTWQDLAYVTTPGEGVDLTESKLKIASTDAEIRVGDSVDDETVAQIRSLADNVLSGLNPNVRVERVAFPKADPAKDPSRLPASEAEKEKTPADKVGEALQKFGALVPVIAALILGFGLWLASRSASQTIAQSAGEIAAGIRNMRPTVTTNPDKPIGIRGLDGGDAEAKGAKLPPPPPRAREQMRNVALVRRMLHENPLPFVRMITTSPEDMKGLKWLLTNLEEGERALLKKFIGAERVASLAQTDDAAVDPSWEAGNWLQRLVESLIVREMSGGSGVDKALAPEQALRLSTAESDGVVGALRKLNQPAAWRVALEFLPKAKVIEALKESDPGLWKMLISGSELTEEALRDGATKLVAELGEAAPQGAGRGTEEKRRFYSNLLLDPAVDSVLSKSLGEDDAFLDELAAMAPDFVEMLRRRVWTPRSLERVEDAGLRDAFLPLPPAQKTALLFVLPEAVTAKLQSYLPEGTGRTIVLDQLKKAREKNDVAEVESATQLAREFLDYLRRQAEEGRLTLKAETNASETAKAA